MNKLANKFKKTERPNRFSLNPINIFIGFIVVLFLSFTLLSFNLQIVSSEDLSNKAVGLNFSEYQLRPKRGNFLDINGNPLTASDNVYSISLYTNDLPSDKLDKIKKFLSENKIGSNVDDILNKINAEDFASLKLLDVNDSALKSFSDTFPEKDFYRVSYYNKRTYLYPDQYTHIIGYLGRVSEEDIKAGYLSDEYRGAYKLESKFEDDLRGTRGKSYYVGDVEIKESPEPGSDVKLTINKDWQVGLYNLMRKYSDLYVAAGAGGAVVDNSNGKVMSLVSFPGFDTNEIIEGIDAGTYDALAKDRQAPFLDKAVGVADEPGSIFKLITSYDLLENKVIDGNSTYFSNRCADLGGGYEFCEFGKLFYGSMNVVRALTKSSNLFFCNYLLQQASNGGLDNLAKSAILFNLGEKTGIDLPGEVAGNVDSVQYRKEVFNLDWFDGDTCNAAIGQGSNLVTPIQMAMVASAIENNGKYYKPTVVEEVKDGYGNITYKNEPEVTKIIPIAEETRNLINEGMSKVAYNPEGTVYYFLNSVPGNVRAKTGTAEAYEDVGGQRVYRTHGWISGTFDHNGKSYSFAFHLRYGGGGFYIGELAKEFINCVYNDFKNECK